MVLSPSAPPPPHRRREDDEIRTSRLGSECPLFTICVFLACVGLMVYECQWNARGVDFSKPPTDICKYQFEFHGHQFCVADMKVNPMLGPSQEVLTNMGAVIGSRITHDDEWRRLFSGPFLHAGWIHCGMNMLALLALCPRMEQVHGFLRVGLIYSLSGLFGAMATATFAPDAISVGASGAIFGLIGASLADVILNWDLYPCPCCTLLRLLVLTVFQLLLGTMPFLDNFAHVFGCLMGFMSAFVLLVRLRKRKRLSYTCGRWLFRSIVALLVVASFALGLALLYQWKGLDAKEFCPDCSRISCSPFPFGCERTGSCWWTCSAAEAPQCKTLPSYVGSTVNGAVDVLCPGSKNAVTVPNLDVTGWNRQKAATLCREHCSQFR